MKIIEFCKDRTVLVECEQCKSTFKSPFVLMERDDFYSVEIDYKYCPYCNKQLDCNREKRRNKMTKLEQEMYNDLQKVREKAQKYDQLTEQLGCPVEVVIKALKEGFYFIRDNEFVYHKCWVSYFVYVVENSFIHSSYFLKSFYLKDYKKTWWLKEDMS